MAVSRGQVRMKMSAPHNSGSGQTSVHSKSQAPSRGLNGGCHDCHQCSDWFCCPLCSIRYWASARRNTRPRLYPADKRFCPSLRICPPTFITVASQPWPTACRRTCSSCCISPSSSSPSSAGSLCFGVGGWPCPIFQPPPGGCWSNSKVGFAR